jgi:hypothetical protein
MDPQCTAEIYKRIQVDSCIFQKRQNIYDKMLHENLHASINKLQFLVKNSA